MQSKKKSEVQRGKPTRYLFRIYIAGNGPNSMIALTNLQNLCEEWALDWELEIVDVMEAAERAMDDKILVTPTLIRLAPLPVVHIWGNLSDKDVVISALGLHRSA